MAYIESGRPGVPYYAVDHPPVTGDELIFSWNFEDTYDRILEWVGYSETTRHIVRTLWEADRQPVTREALIREVWNGVINPHSEGSSISDIRKKLPKEVSLYTVDALRALVLLPTVPTDTEVIFREDGDLIRTAIPNQLTLLAQWTLAYEPKNRMELAQRGPRAATQIVSLTMQNFGETVPTGVICESARIHYSSLQTSVRDANHLLEFFPSHEAYAIHGSAGNGYRLSRE